MQKVYLLLRNNKQSGPYSLEELVQSGIKPLDLIWIEGTSTSWCYPAEISALKPYTQEAATDTSLNKTLIDETKAVLPAEALSHQAYLPLNRETNPAPKEASPKVYVSLPKNNVKPPAQQQDLPSSSLEQKATEIRARARAYLPEQKATAETIKNIETLQQQDIIPSSIEQKAAEIRARALAYVPEQNATAKTIKNIKPPAPDYVKEDKTPPIFKKISVNRNEVIKKSPAVITVALLLLAGGYLISRYSSEKQENNPQVTIRQMNTDSFNVQPFIAEPDPQQTDVATVKNNFTEKPEPEKPIANKPEPVNNRASEPPVVIKTKPVVSEKPKEEINKIQSKKVIPVLPPQPTVNNPPVAGSIEKKVEDPVAKQEDHVEQTDKAEEDKGKAAEAMKKKKTFTEKIDGFFSKISKKRLEDPEAEKSPPTSTNETRERKVVRRGEEVDVPQKKANLHEFVDVTSKESSGNWMLGVYGLKLIIHNRSSETVKRAAVEVRYYNEHEELIEKKVVNVNNVPPNKTVTVAAPDHRLADHTDLKLLSASN